MNQIAMTFNNPRAGYPDMPASRDTDTSKEAAGAMLSRAGTIRAQVMNALDVRPQTTDEVAEKLGLSVLAVRPRFSELRKTGKIEDSGQRRANGSGKKAIVWCMLAEGGVNVGGEGESKLPKAYRDMLAREEKRKALVNVGGN